MGAVHHCPKCRRYTAHVDGQCQRCVFGQAHRKPMSAEAKKRLKALRDWRRGKIDTDPRLAAHD